MNNSGSTRRSAQSALALSRAARALAAFPVMSPTVGFSWASVIVNLGSVMGRWCLAQEQTANARFIAFSSELGTGSREENASKQKLRYAVLIRIGTAYLERAYAFGDGKQPERACHQQRDADRRRTHVLDPPDLRIVVGGEPVGELLDRSIENLDHQHERHRRHQFHPAHHARANQPGQRHRQRQRKKLLTDSLLRADRKGEAVTRVDGSPPESQQVKAPLRPASAFPCRRVPASAIRRSGKPYRSIVRH